MERVSGPELTSDVAHEQVGADGTRPQPELGSVEESANGPQELRQRT